MKRLDILHCVPYVGENSFGLGQISVSLAQSQYKLGHDVNIWSLENKVGIKWASVVHNFPLERITGFKLRGPSQIWYSPEMKNMARRNSDGVFDVVHQHGIWTGVSSATLKFSQKKQTPTIIAPHGSLNQWAMNTSKFKKKIALSIYERKNLGLASCLHATSENEISDFRNFGLTNPIAYIENGIQEKFLSINGNAERFRQQNDCTNDKRILFFLSRISPKKGLKMLVKAIKSMEEDFSNWQLIIAGIDEFNHKEEIENLIKELKLEGVIRIIGSVFDQAKADAFAAAELFILPSFSEGSPMVVLDSLAAGVPVITTKASTWSDLTEYNCGWWTEINEQEIAFALRKAVMMSADELQLMGENGKELIASKYVWPKLADKTLTLYNWLLGQEDKPDFVLLD